MKKVKKWMNVVHFMWFIFIPSFNVNCYHYQNPDGNCEHYLVLLDEDSMDEKWSHWNCLHPPSSSSSSSSFVLLLFSAHGNNFSLQWHTCCCFALSLSWWASSLKISIKKHEGRRSKTGTGNHEIIQDHSYALRWWWSTTVICLTELEHELQTNPSFQNN
jgi:hypothetical protein